MTWNRYTIGLILTCGMLNTYGDTFRSFNLTTQTSPQNPWIADLWLPLHDKAGHYLFTDVNGSYSSLQYNRSLELGSIYRKRGKNEWAWGGYAFASYNRTRSGAGFFTLNPGLEYLNERWHLSTNAYLPINSARQGIGPWVWADEVGIYQYMRFSHHDQFNQRVRQTASTGVGVDLIAGYHFQSLGNTKLSAGVYYFNMPSHPMGVVSLIETPTYKNISFNVGFIHDPIIHTQFTLGVKLHLDGKKDINQSTDWVNDRVQHNLPQLTQANTIPIQTGYRNEGIERLQKDNIWFFTPQGPSFKADLGLLNCTYEHPCSGLNSDTTETIPQIAANGHFVDQPSLYIAPGSYIAPLLALYGNESLIGRTDNYLFPAMGSGRPQLFTDGLIIDGVYDNQTNTVANLSINNIGGNFYAVNIGDAQNVYLNNLQIGSFNATNPENHFAEGVFIFNSQNIYLTNSTLELDNVLTGNLSDVIGLNAQGVQNFVIQDSVIQSRAYNASINATGLAFMETNHVTVQNSQFDQHATGTDSLSVNIVTNPGGVVDLLIENSTFSSSTYGDNSGAGNIELVSSSTASINHSSFYADTESVSTNGSTFNFQIEEQARVVLSNSRVTGVGQSISGASAATNFKVSNNGELVLVNDKAYASGQCALVTGSTSITLSENAVASIYGGTLETVMAGGPSLGKPSGAVTIWVLDNSHVTVSHAKIIARSENSITGAVAIQAQKQSQVSVNHSVIKSIYTAGNTTETDSATVVAADNSAMNIQNSIISLELMGSVTKNVAVVTTDNQSVVTVTNSQLTAFNSATPLSDNLMTYAAFANGTSIIYLNSDAIFLSGPNTATSGTTGNGQVIITN